MMRNFRPGRPLFNISQCHNNRSGSLQQFNANESSLVVSLLLLVRLFSLGSQASLVSVGPLVSLDSLVLHVGCNKTMSSERYSFMR